MTLQSKGNTPTCVGKTQLLTLPELIIRKHPHVRGEDYSQLEHRAERTETPPRAWGRLNLLAQCGGSLRNTPTCVGKTATAQIHCVAVQKHPHVRGEDAAMAGVGGQKTETPPRAWGRPKWEDKNGVEIGNTPTCVGKTMTWCTPTSSRRKHPHVRGEDLHRRLYGFDNVETPPRAWGRPFAQVSSEKFGGNTPTCVGKTKPRRANSR